MKPRPVTVFVVKGGRLMLFTEGWKNKRPYGKGQR